VINNVLRIGNPTSSEIHRILKTSKRGTTLVDQRGSKNPFAGWPGGASQTFIDECNMERRHGKSLETEVFDKKLAWGNIVEKYVFGLLGMNYTLTSNVSFSHPHIPYWVGSPDAHNDDTCGEIKSPFTRKSFSMLVDPMMKYKGMDAMQAIRDTHESGEKYYWQVLSNSCILGKKYQELQVYMPYQSELKAIRHLVHKLPGSEVGRYMWIANSIDDDLPYLPDGGYYKNLNILKFEAPKEDRELLEQAMAMVGEYLEPWPEIENAS
jgi:hypothetical protein